VLSDNYESAKKYLERELERLDHYFKIDRIVINIKLLAAEDKTDKLLMIDGIIK
jgi:hypothetical protein